jgi:hypothetical protein
VAPDSWVEKGRQTADLGLSGRHMIISLIWRPFPQLLRSCSGARHFGVDLPLATCLQTPLAGGIGYIRYQFAERSSRVDEALHWISSRRGSPPLAQEIKKGRV